MKGAEGRCAEQPQPEEWRERKRAGEQPSSWGCTRRSHPHLEGRQVPTMEGQMYTLPKVKEIYKKIYLKHIQSVVNEYLPFVNNMKNKNLPKKRRGKSLVPSYLKKTPFSILSHGRIITKITHEDWFVPGCDVETAGKMSLKGWLQMLLFFNEN